MATQGVAQFFSRFSSTPLKGKTQDARGTSRVVRILKLVVLSFFASACFFAFLDYRNGYGSGDELILTDADGISRLVTVRSTQVYSAYYAQVNDEIVMLAEVDKAIPQQEGYFSKFRACELNGERFVVNRITGMRLNDWVELEFPETTHMSYEIGCSITRRQYIALAIKSEGSMQIRLIVNDAGAAAGRENIGDYATFATPLVLVKPNPDKPRQGTATAVCIATLDGGAGVHDPARWILHMKDAGVSAVYMYYERSFVDAFLDRLMEEVGPLMHGYVQLIDWVPRGALAFYRAQHLALQDCMYRAKAGGYSHVITVDTDEYYIGSQNADFRAAVQKETTLISDIAAECKICCALQRQIAVDGCPEDFKMAKKAHTDLMKKKTAHILGRQRLLYEQFPPKGLINLDQFLDGMVTEHTVHGCSLIMAGPEHRRWNKQAALDWSPIHQDIPPSRAFLAHLRGAEDKHQMDCSKIAAADVGLAGSAALEAEAIKGGGAN